jgi:hypothetical protein
MNGLARYEVDPAFSATSKSKSVSMASIAWPAEPVEDRLVSWKELL